MKTLMGRGVLTHHGTTETAGIGKLALLVERVVVIIRNPLVT